LYVVRALRAARTDRLHAQARMLQGQPPVGADRRRARNDPHTSKVVPSRRNQRRMLRAE
jgi:hypothetical protein